MTTLNFLQINNHQGSNLLQRMVLPMRRRAARKALKTLLLRMDDHMLRDMGLKRFEVLGDLF